jgi:hypothetical protein
MLFRLSFVTLILAAVSLGTPVKRDADTVGSDIEGLQVQVQTLDTSVNALPSSGGTPAQVLAIHDDVTKLDAAIKSATNDVIATADLTDAQADTINGLLAKLATLVEKALDDLVAKKPALAADDATKIAKSDLQNLKTNSDGFGNAMLVKTPEAKKSDLQKQLSAMDSAFSSAINEYST